MNSTVSVEFAEAPFEIIDGDRGKNYPKQSDYLDSGYCLFLSATNVTKTGFDFSDCLFIDQEKDAALNKGRLQREDIVLTTRGTIGNVAYFNNTVPFENLRINSGMVILRCDKAKMSPAFLYHFLRSPLFHDQVNSLRSGVAQPQLPIRDMLRIKLPLPSMPEQRRIAGILSAYDELIENSQRRIRILDEMARALYREWFVHFRFPGHESHPRVASPLGDIPRGWEGRFGDLATIARGGINPFEFPDEEFEHFSIPAFDKGRQPAIELGGTILSSKYRIDDSTVLLSKLNPRIPRVWLPALSKYRRAITSTEFLGLKPQPGVTREFIYAKCSSEEFAGQFGCLAIGTSTSHQRVKPENLLAMPSTVPDQKTVARFTKLVSPILKGCQQLRSQSENLRGTRDLLLQRLLR